MPVFLAVLILSYLIGSIPTGFLLVKLMSGQDVRLVGSGRTGGTNAWRAAGRGAGLLTALLDALKASACVWLARAIVTPDFQAAAMVGGGLCAILGHNYPVFLKFRGGAGGAPTVGGAFALWPMSLLIILPIGILVWQGVGYASLATLSVSLAAIAVFAVRAAGPAAQSPAEFIWYGVGAFVLLAWALRPNLRRLLRGEEPRFNWRRGRRGQGNDPSPPAA